MKRLMTVFLVVGVVFLFSSSSLAQKYHKGHNFGISYNIADFNYERAGTDKDGLMQGFSLDYFNENRKDLFVGFNFDYLIGDINTKGNIIKNSNIDIDSDSQNYIVDGKLIAGKRINHKGLTWRPYTGFGIRYWDNKVDGLEGTIDGINVSYDGSESTYYYTPIGTMVSRDLNNKWHLKLNVFYKLFWSGDVKYNYNVGNYSDDIDVSQDFFDAHGFTASIDLTYNLNQYTISLNPYINYWDVEESDITNIGNSDVYFYEPSNETLMYGSKITLNF